MDAGVFTAQLMARIADSLRLRAGTIAAVSIPLLTATASCSNRASGTSSGGASAGSGEEGPDDEATASEVSTTITSSDETEESSGVSSGDVLLDVGDGGYPEDDCELESVRPEIDLLEMCEVPVDLPLWSDVGAVCFYPPEGGSCEDHPHTDRCIIESAVCTWEELPQDIVCGPIETDSGQCCFVAWGVCLPPGRPFVVDEVPRLATLEPDASWSSAQTPSLEGLDADTLAALADVWAQDGLFEHASVASFSRFALQLLSLGAPADLLVETQRAIAEEIEHAQICFGLASAYAGRPLGPGALDISGGLDPKGLTPEEIGRSLAAEGCVAETVSAVLIANAAARATDPAVRSALTQIAEEEGRHALLAWRTLDWMLESHPQCRAAVEEAFADAEKHVALGAFTNFPHDAELMQAHGQLAPNTRAESAMAAVLEVVRPLARERLGQTGHRPPLPRAIS